jgi:CheY-like chemotaxis protein
MVLGLISDLFFVSRVQAAARGAGLDFIALDLYKTPAEFIEVLRKEPPSLIVLDLNSSLPWPEWLPAAKADPQLAAIPWLAFGSHMNPRRLAAARHAGADKVVPKSKLDEELMMTLKQLTQMNADKHG